MEQEINKYKAALKKAAKKIEELSNKINENEINEDIAVIGYGCRFPGGANDPGKFWDILVNGVDTVTEIDKSRFDFEKYYSDDTDEVGKMNTNAGAFLNVPVDEFDNRHFEISPLEASAMDPQQRLLLEVSWEAMENAGLNIKKLQGSDTGIFVGVNSSDYFRAHMYSGDTKKINSYSVTGITFGAACGRLSYFYDFKGPAVTFDTACSSSLVALKAAMESLKKNECSIALLGGVNLLLSPESFIGLSKIHGLSKDGRCRAFDESADGFGRGEGCGVIVLKKMSRARADGDVISAVIKGVFVGQDGRTNGIAAPNGSAQKNVIKRAMEQACISADDIDYVETHGTGTPLGDSIEAQVLGDIFKDKKNPLLIGAVKTNVAHLEAASGMAGLIKIILSLEHNQIPPSIHLNNKNPNINWSHIEVVTKPVAWKRGEKVRRAGISSFGFTGTLAHAIIEEAPLDKLEEEVHELSYHLMTLSAKSKEALKNTINNMKDYLRKSGNSINDICYSSNVYKSHMDYRLAVSGKSREDILSKLEDDENLQENFSCNAFRMNNIVFLFTGQGSIYRNIGKEYYESSPVFKKALDVCDQKFREILNISILDAVYGEDDNVLQKAVYSQPVIFSIEYALTRIWDSLGIKAMSVVGHSIGEYAAACYAGVLNLDDAIKMIAYRGQIMDSVNIDGKMAGVLTSAETVRKAIRESGCQNVFIAAVNAPQNVTISGLREEVDRVIEKIQEKQRVFVDKLNITHPFHSVLMKEYCVGYYEKIKDIQYSKGKVDIISSITGDLKDERTFGDVNYWTNHLCNTVDFYKAIETAKEYGGNIFIEIGGDATLCGLANQCLLDGEELFLPSLRKGGNGYKQLFDSVRLLYLNGVEIQWRSFYEHYKREKVDLPTYAFNRKSFWMDLNSDIVNDATGEAAVSSAMSKATVARVLEFRPGAIHEKNKYEPVVLNKPKKSSHIIRDEKTIEADIKNIVNIITGLVVDEINSHDNLFTLGFDSLLLLNFKKRIDTKYNTNISLNDFFLKLNTVEAIAGYIYQHMPETAETLVEQVQEALPDMGMFNHYGNTPYFANIEDQINSMHAQLEYILDMSRNEVAGNKAGSNAYIRSEFPKTNNAAMIFEKDFLTAKQRKFLDDFILQYNTKTRNSKEYVSKYKPVFSDWINSLNFRTTIKELIYPIVSKSSQGARFWDIDGNEYIDLAMGYGVHYFGHNPQFVTDAIMDQLGKGFELGPQCELAGKVAELISELTGVERVAFCNTGSEAVMVALRIARASRGKEKIVKFSGSYHGAFDGILTNTDEEGPYPTSPGTTYGMVKDTVSLLYGSKESLEYIRENKEDIAAILVEPVQSRRPGFYPKEFLKELRALTEETGIILIFDEMVNGFRIQVGGAQAYFGIKADIVTYGKILGGGLPIGVVAGKKEYIDTIDGGSWSFGDDSRPEKETIIFAGTFCKNPLSMAAAYAALSYMKEKGDVLQQGVNAKTKFFTEEVNAFFESENVPVRVRYFGSQFKFESFGKYDLSLFPIEMELFFYLLNAKGVYTWERRTCCFCTEITDDDVKTVIDKIKESIYELRQGGFEFSDKTRADNKVVPMSINQKRLFSTILINEGDPYNIIGALEITGAINVGKLEAVLQKIIERHESLRTTLYIKDDRFVQEVKDSIDFKIDIIQKESSKDLDELIEETICWFDLFQGPLIKVTLIRVSPGRAILLFDFHHTIADGRSLDIFGQELITLYSGRELGPIHNQYSDYVLWEEKFLASDEIKESEGYWLKKLSGEVAKLNLPLDRNSGTMGSIAGDTVRMTIGEGLVNDLKQFSKKSGASLFMVLVASFNVLLHKLSGTEDIVIGTPVTNRGNGTFDSNIGMFTNTIVLRNQLSEDKSFKGFLDEVRQSSLEAYAHMNYPFNFLINRLNADSKGGRNTLIDAMFVYENIDKRVFKIDDVEIKTYEYKSKIAEFGFTMEILEENGVFNINLTYKTDILNRDSISRWGEYYRTILESIVKDSSISIADIQLMTEYDRQKILCDFNDTKTDYPKGKTIGELFQEQAKKTPDKTAVVFGDKRLIYSELNKKANQLARVLRNTGVGPGTIVGLMVERSLEMIVGIMGILKAGGAYLPIDLEYPADRIKYMLEDSGARIMLIQSSLAGRVTCEIRTIAIDDASLYKGNCDDVDKAGSSENLAYIIYTSGSTGKPKGTLISHYSVTRVVRATNYIDIAETDVLLQLSSYLFDGSVFDIYGTLLNGATLVIPDKYSILEVEKLGSLIEKEKISIFFTTTALFNSLVDIRIKSLQNIRKVIFGGERVSFKHVKKALEILGPGKIIHVYGPTECTVFATYYPVDHIDERDVTIPIGKPISNTELYVVGKNNQLQPIGLPGELCIAGDGLAVGYLNRKDLNEEKFVNNPFETGSIMYRTGDLVKWLPDGNIEFIDRIDQQVKIRGFRIELGEIESALLTISGISEATVLVKEREGNKYLCACYVTDNEYSVEFIKEKLKKFLPGFMIPSYFIRVEKMPLNINGKIDKKKLMEIGGDISTAVEYELPRNTMEEKLVEIWKDILGLDKVGINDNFFEIGGHSLNAAILTGRIHKALNVRVSIKDLFRAETIKVLGAYIQENDKVAYREIEKIEKREYYPVSAAQKRMYTSQQKENGTAYNMSKAIEVLGELDVNKLEKTMKQLIERHESLRTSFDIADQEIVQRVHEAEEVDSSVETIIVNNEQEVPQKIEGFIRLFDLETAPLMRVGVIKLEDRRNIIVFDIHHIIADGISVSILTKEFSALYTDRELEDLKVQYKDYSSWQLKKLESIEIKKQEDFWLKEFSGKLPKAKLPTDYPSPAKRDFRGDTVTFKLDREITEKLKKIGQKISATLYMILLAELNILLSKYCQEEDIVVGTPIAGRTHRDLENVIGMFVNTLAIRSNVNKELSFEEYLEAVKEKTLLAFDNQEYQFEELVQKVAANSDISKNPLFDVMFAVQNVTEEQIEMGTLTVRSYPFAEKTEKFNLTIECWERDEGLTVNVSYATSLYKRETIEKIIEYYRYIITLTSGDTGITIENINLITKDELANFYRNSDLNDLNKEDLEFTF